MKASSAIWNTCGLGLLRVGESQWHAMRIQGLADSIARAVPIRPRDCCMPDGRCWRSANRIPGGSAGLVIEVVPPSRSGSPAVRLTSRTLRKHGIEVDTSTQAKVTHGWTFPHRWLLPP